MANSKLQERAKELGLKPVEDEPDEDLLARINEAQNSEHFDPTDEKAEEAKEEPLAAGVCPNCKGEGIVNPTDTRVCQNCEGTGKA